MSGRASSLTVGLLLIAAFWAGWLVNGWRADATLAQVQQQHAQEQAQAMAVYQRMEQTKDEAIKAAEQRAASNRADAHRAAVAVGRLQRDLADVPTRIAGATRAAVDEYAATAGELLGACSAEYQWLAGQADGHATDARLIRETWPMINQ